MGSKPGDSSFEIIVYFETHKKKSVRKGKHLAAIICSRENGPEMSLVSIGILVAVV
jgi:hypothetical protein